MYHRHDVNLILFLRMHLVLLVNKKSIGDGEQISYTVIQFHAWENFSQRIEVIPRNEWQAVSIDSGYQLMCNKTICAAKWMLVVFPL